MVLFPLTLRMLILVLMSLMDVRRVTTKSCTATVQVCLVAFQYDKTLS